MSKQNKVNKSNYDQAGRLTPDDMARERKKMMPATQPVRDQVKGKASGPRHDEPASSQDRSEREESE